MRKNYIAKVIPSNMLFYTRFFPVISVLAFSCMADGQEIKAAGQPAQLDIRAAGLHSIRITLKPVGLKDEFPFSPAVVEQSYKSTAISIKEINEPLKRKVGNLFVEVRPAPLTVIVTNERNEPVQQITFPNDGNLSF